MAAHAPEELHAILESSLNAQDVESLVDLYDDDATLIVPPRGSRATGREAIRRAMTATVAGGPRARMQVLDKIESDGLALTHGRWTLAGTDEDGAPVEMSGFGSIVSRCQPDGSWKIVLDNPMSFEGRL